MSDDTPILQNAHAYVSATRVVLNGTTYATRNIAAVSTVRKKRRRFGPDMAVLFGLIWFGMALLFASPVNIALGATLAGWGLYQLFRPSQYTVVLATSGGHIDGLTLTNKAATEQIASAIATAITQR